MLTNGRQLPTVTDKQGRTYMMRPDPAKLSKLAEVFVKVEGKKGKARAADAHVVALVALAIDKPFETVEALFEMKELHRAVKALAAMPERELEL
jgi:hypothetical protein